MRSESIRIDGRRVAAGIVAEMNAFGTGCGRRLPRLACPAVPATLLDKLAVAPDAIYFRSPLSAFGFPSKAATARFCHIVSAKNGTKGAISLQVVSRHS